MPAGLLIRTLLLNGVATDATLSRSVEEGGVLRRGENLTKLVLEANKEDLLGRLDSHIVQIGFHSVAYYALVPKNSDSTADDYPWVDPTATRTRGARKVEMRVDLALMRTLFEFLATPPFMHPRDAIESAVRGHGGSKSFIERAVEEGWVVEVSVPSPQDPPPPLVAAFLPNTLHLEPGTQLYTLGARSVLGHLDILRALCASYPLVSDSLRMRAWPPPRGAVEEAVALLEKHQPQLNRRRSAARMRDDVISSEEEGEAEDEEGGGAHADVPLEDTSDDEGADREVQGSSGGGEGSGDE